MTRRLVLSYLTVTLVVLAMLEIPLAVFFDQREFDRLVSDAERDATVLASYYEDALEDHSTVDPTKADEYTATTGARVVLVDHRAQSLIDTGDYTGRNFASRPEIAVALDGRRSAGERYSKTLEQDLLYVSVPVASGGTVHGALRLTFDPHEVTERVQRFWWALAAIAVVVLAIVATMGYLIARSVIRPIHKLQSGAARFASGDLTELTLQPGAPAEIQDLESAMNTMAARLDRVITQQREFVGDASHQLRTPLTALRLQLENLTHSLGPDERAEAEAAIAETDRLANLVADLLALARTEQTPTTSRIDLAAAARERGEIWTAVAEEHGVVLRLVLDGVGDQEPVLVDAVDGAIDQMLDNLIDNAINVSPADAPIELRLRSSPGQATLAVADRGPGLDDEAKSRATERFWRGDMSSPGTGLGLAIVSRLANACGADFYLADNEPAGLQAVLEFDRVAAAVGRRIGAAPAPVSRRPEALGDRPPSDPEPGRPADQVV